MPGILNRVCWCVVVWGGKFRGVYLSPAVIEGVGYKELGFPLHERIAMSFVVNLYTVKAAVKTLYLFAAPIPIIQCKTCYYGGITDILER